MAEEIKVTPKGYEENPDLLPTPLNQRRYGVGTFSFMMFSMNTCIPMFFLGPIGAGMGLSIWQVLVGAFIGNLAAGIVMWLNGSVGVKHAVSYPIQLRESFGFRGMRVPLVLRGIAGTVWFGIEAYVGSLALTMIVVWLRGVPAEQVMSVAIRYLPIALVFYCGSFIAVMRYGLKAIGRVAVWGGPLLLIYYMWLVIWLTRTPQFAANIPNLFVSTAGYFSVGFLIYLAVQTNWWATIALNISDLSRGIDPKKPSALPIGVFVGMVICQIAGTALGYMAATLTGHIVPQDLIVTFAPGIPAVMLGLVFCFLAPWSTDIIANSPPLMDLLMTGTKVSWKRATVLAAVIAFFVAPWWAVQSGPGIVDYITAWASNYGILLGPIAGIMIGNFWVVRKRKYDVQKLYTYGPDGCWYSRGWSKAAYASFVLTWVLCYLIAWLTGQITVWGGFPFPGGVIWYAAVLLSFGLYILFAQKVFKTEGSS